MNSGDFVYINYVGKVKDSGEIFDLTKEDIAKKEGIFNSKFKYGPVPVVVDSKLILPGLNDALKEMKVGEKKKVEIKPENAFGQRNPDLMKLIPESMFKGQNTETKPGSFVTIRGIKGRIASVAGGRVRVDFNHPLAGKTLEYEIEIISKIEKKDEKIKSIVYYFTGIGKEDIDISIDKNQVEITIKKKAEILRRTKEIISNTIIKWVEGIEKIKFVETFEK